MKGWFLITHNLDGSRLERATEKLTGLGVEVYSPIRKEFKRRTDCGSVRMSVKQLFPGYLFLQFDPEHVHTTTISDLHGMKSFVRFGTRLAQPTDNLVKALKSSLLLRTEQSASCIEFRNLPENIQLKLLEIAELPARLDREIALLNLLQKMSVTVDCLSFESIVSNY